MSTSYLRVEFVTTDGHTQRSRELMNSVARSHAARVTWLRRTTTGHRRYRAHTYDRDEEKARAQSEIVARIRASRQGRSALSPVLAHVPYTVNYYINHVIPNIRTVFDVFQVKNFWDDHWLRCLSKEPYYSAFSAYLQLIRDSSADPQHRIPSASLLQYKLRAIQVLRRQLADSLYVDDVSLLAMVKLGFVEAQLDGCFRYDLHRQALSKLVQDRRGSEVMSTCVAPLVSAYDLYRSMHTAVPPLPQSRIFGPPVMGDLLTNIAPSLIEDLPSGFRQLARYGKLPLELVRALSRTNKLLHDRQQQTPSTPYSHAGEVSTNLSQPELHVGWWTACPSLLAHPVLGNEEHEIGNLLSMSLWLYVAMEFSTDSAFETFQHWISVARWLRQDLTTKLMGCVMIREDNEESCLIWITRLAIESWRGPDQKLLPQGLDLDWFRRRRFVWPHDPDQGFFVFTKGSELS